MSPRDNRAARPLAAGLLALIPSLIFALVFSLVFGLLGARAAHAAEDAAALIEEGKSLRQAGDDQGAFKAFSRAYALQPSPRAAGQLGMCERNLDHWFESETHLAEALRAAEDPWVVRNEEALRAQLAYVREHLGRLEIIGEPSGAEVEVGGQVVGRLPLRGPVRVVVGVVNVRVSAPGFRTVRKDVTVATQETQRLDIDLVAAPTSARVTPIAGVPLPPEAPGAPAAPPPADGNQWKRPAGWTAAGLSVLLAAGGVASLMVSTNRIDQFNKYDRAPFTTDMRCNSSVKGDGGSVCASLLDQGNQWKTIGYVSIGGAVAAGILSIVLLASAPGSDVALAPPATLSAHLDCGPILAHGNTGAVCGWRF